MNSLQLKKQNEINERIIRELMNLEEVLHLKLKFSSINNKISHYK